MSKPSPIHWLSHELLSYILFIASTQEGGASHAGQQQNLRYTARFAAQVNQQWRAAALQCKHIWLGNPVLNWYSPPKWVAEVLRRSEPLPLDVIIPLEAANRCPLVVSVALMHLARIRVLGLELVANAWWFIAKSRQLKTRAPFLEQFSLVIKPGLDKRRIYVPEPNNMFGGYAPRLMHFQVRNCSVDLSHSMCNSLRVLIIREMQIIPVSDLLDVLRQMKFLQKFQFSRDACDAIESDADMISIDTGEVHLLNLSELSISASTSICASLLRSLVLPDFCAIEVDAQDVGKSHHDLAEVLSHFKSILSTWSCEPLSGRQRLRVSMTEVGYTLEGLEDDDHSKGPHPFLSLTLSWFDHPSREPLLLAALPMLAAVFGQCLQPPDTLSLAVDSDIPYSLYSDVRSVLLPWFTQLHYIQALEFYTHEAFVLTEKFFQGPRRDVLLPELGDLTFCHVDFATERRHCWRRLLKILKFRGSGEVDAPVLQLDFIKCIGEFRNENLAARFGTVVKINGREYSDEEEDEVEEASDYTIQGLSD